LDKCHGIVLAVDGSCYLFKRTENKIGHHTCRRLPGYRQSGIVILLSAEMYQVNLWLNYKDEWTWWENLYYKAGSVFFGAICSFIMMWLGMHYKFRPLRIISLSLFTITLIKLFVYDIRNIPPGGKIAAFILLGILLLTVSFMYQRLKKIIIDDAENDPSSV
jgi:hypothetical protein